QITYTDPAVAPPPHDPKAVLEEVAAAPSLARGLAEAEWMSPTYEVLRAALRRALSANDLQTVRLLRPKLERARALPPDLGRRYIWVNAAAQELELWQDGRIADRMDVVIGKRSEPT